MKKDVAVERAKLLSFVADYNAKAAAETAKYREIEQHLVVTRDSIQKAHDANIQTVVLVADDFAAESRRLQQHAASAPSRRRDPPTAASCAADRGRAEAAGILLAGYVQADVERTALLERRERDIEALSGWILTVRSAVNERSRKPHDAVAQAGAD